MCFISKIWWILCQFHWHQWSKVRKTLRSFQKYRDLNPQVVSGSSLPHSQIPGWKTNSFWLLQLRKCLSTGKDEAQKVKDEKDGKRMDKICQQRTGRSVGFFVRKFLTKSNPPFGHPHFSSTGTTTAWSNKRSRVQGKRTCSGFLVAFQGGFWSSVFVCILVFIKSVVN